MRSPPTLAPPQNLERALVAEANVNHDTQFYKIKGGGGVPPPPITNDL